MYNEQLEALIEAALADGVLTEKEKQVLFKKAQSMGVDLDEFEVVLDARMIKLQKEEKAKAASAPKSNKLGDVRKCPQCGAVIGTFQMSCPECGYEFNNVGVNKYVEEFSRQFNKLAKTTDYGKQHGYVRLFDLTGEHEQQRRAQILEQAEVRFIKNYPLPMSKEDCIEMLNFIAPKISLSNSNSVTFVWKKKYDAILQKLARESKGNQQILDLVKSYQVQGHTNIFTSFALWYKSLSKMVRTTFWFVMFYAVFFGGGCSLLYSYLDDSPSREDNDLVQTYINNGDIHRAMSLIHEGADPTPLYEYYIDNEMWDEAEDYIPHEYSRVSKEEYYSYMKRAVTAMCKAGKQKEAKKFIKRKVVFYEEYNAPEKYGHDEWNTTIIEKKLEAIVTNF